MSELLDKSTRNHKITRAGIIGILVNLLLAIIKIIIGRISNSVAIISDATNNLSDAGSSVITIIGSALSVKRPNDKHPYGYGRIEYFSGLIISVIVFVLGVEFLKSSISIIRNPEPVKFSWISVLIIAGTVIVKIFLSIYNKRVGSEVNSTALIASGTEALGDAAISFLTLISALIALFTDYKVDGYIGLIVSIFIFYSGYQLIKETFNNIIGQKISKELSQAIYAQVEQDQLVLGAYDLILNNYGPNKYIGSINVELEDFRTVKEASELFFSLQSQIYKTFGIFLVISLYSVNTNNDRAVKVRKQIQSLLSEYEYISNMHAFFLDEIDSKLRFDIIINFEIENIDALRKEIVQKIKVIYPKLHVNINVDRKFS